jgi:hypothetical protein
MIPWGDGAEIPVLLEHAYQFAEAIRCVYVLKLLSSCPVLVNQSSVKELLWTSLVLYAGLMIQHKVMWTTMRVLRIWQN